LITVVEVVRATVQECGGKVCLCEHAHDFTHLIYSRQNVAHSFGILLGVM
ncbi:hypothetical protein LCGC14_1809150, partial [marine sediment metagenome]